MVDTMSLYVDNPTKNKPEVAGTNHAKNTQEASNAGNGVSDALVYAYFLLVDSMNIQAASALTHAKALAANAYSQNRIISKQKQIDWKSLPKEQIQKHHKKHRTRTIYSAIMHEHIRPTKHKKHSPVKQVLNQGQIDAVNMANEEANKLRQDLQGQLSLLQQNAQVGETMVSTVINQSVQTTQESSSILDMLKSLTNRIAGRGGS